MSLLARVAPVFFVALLWNVHVLNASDNTTGSVRVAHPESENDAGRRFEDGLAARLGLDRSANWQRGINGPLCGPYAACSALRLLGADVSPSSFITGKYVGDCQGSTEQEVAAVVEDSGFSAHVAHDLSTLDIFLAEMPLIALVRSSPDSDRFDHWVTVDPSSGKAGFVIHDGSLEPFGMSIAEFSALWSGNGIFVSPSGQSPWLAVIVVRLTILVVVVLAFVLVARLSKRFGRLDTMRGQSLMIGTMALLLAMPTILLLCDLPNHRSGIALANAPYGERLRGVELEQVMGDSEFREVLFVDARYDEDFVYDGLEQAVNIPIYATLPDIKHYLSAVPREVEIVVYCQSRACGFDEIVARRLCSLGFENVAVAENGIFELRATASVQDG